MNSGGFFYLADVKTLSAENKISEEKNVLHFRFPKTGFDDRASRQHVKDFSVDYSNFMLANPDFKNPWGDEPDAVYVNNKVLNPGDTVGQPVGGREPGLIENTSDQELTRKSEEPSEGVDLAPDSAGSEAPSGATAAEAQEEDPTAKASEEAAKTPKKITIKKAKK